MKKVDHRIEIQLLVVYILQVIGEMTGREIKDALEEKVKFKGTLPQIKSACKDLQRKGIISIIYTPGEEDKWGVREVKFSKAPEIAHFSKLLPKLLENEDILAFKGELDKKESDGKGKVREPDICHYEKVMAVFENYEPILGGRMNNGSELLSLPRDENGEIYIPHSWWRGWLGNHLRQANMADSKVQYIFTKGYLPEISQVIKKEIPVAISKGSGSGRGIARHEALDVKSKLKVEFKFPTKGFMTKHQFCSFLKEITEYRSRGLGANSKNYGGIKLIEVS